MNHTPETLLAAIKTDGYLILRDRMAMEDCNELKNAVQRSIELEAPMSSEDHPFHQSSILPIIQGRSLIDLLENDRIFEPFEWILGDDCILYAMISACKIPHHSTYTNRIHNDFSVRIKDSYLRILGILMLDDFKMDNGAPLFMKGSQQLPQCPTEQTFADQAIVMEGKAGDVLYFDPLIWHSAGQNISDHWRNGLLICMVQPWMKQWIDLPRAIQQSDVNISDLSDKALRRLGFSHQPPTNLKEFYEANYKDNWYKRNAEIK